MQGKAAGDWRKARKTVAQPRPRCGPRLIFGAVDAVNSLFPFARPKRSRGPQIARQKYLSLVPTVIETTGPSERAYDIYSRLLKDRIVLLGSEVNDAVASLICAQLLFLESQDPEKEISLYINSPGGSVTAGLAIYDTMRYITSPVTTVCMGRAASMGAFLLAAGEPGMRFALPNSQIMIHQPSGGFQGQATDIEIHAREVLRLKERLNRMLAENTRRPYEDVVKATERDNFLTPEEARELGIIDRVLASRREMAQEKSE